MKTFALALASTLALSAGCATTGQGLPGRDGKSPASNGELDLDGVAPDDASRRFPERLTRAELPAADRISHRIAQEHNGAVAAEVRLCVTPEGKVGAVDLLSSSGMPAYDQAVVDTIATWQYAAYPAPSDTRVCEKVTVTYRTP
jgi:TonB family protein